MNINQNLMKVMLAHFYYKIITKVNMVPGKIDQDLN